MKEPMPHHNESESGQANLNGTQFYYETAGAGQPVVFVHAGIADRRMWDDQFQTFASHYRVIRYDMRGYGKTPMVAGAFSHRQDLRSLLEFLHIERACLVGCSQGGSTLIDFALEHPESVSALILVACAPHGHEFAGEAPKQWDDMVAAFKQGDFARAAELEVQIWVDGPHRTPDQVDSTIRERVREMDVIALANEASNLGSESALEPAAAHRLADIRAPTLVVLGDLDDPNIVSGGEFLATNIAGAQKVVITGAAHLPNMERPDEFNRVVLEFLRRRVA